MTRIYSTLDKHPDLYNETISLIEREFNYPQDHSFKIDFYPLINKNNLQHCHILIYEGHVIAHIGIKLRNIGNNKFSSPVALIGGIAVNSKYHGQGVFRDFFEKVLDDHKNYVSLFLLWGNLDQLYQKFGFIQAGGIIQTGTGHIINLEQFEKTKLIHLNNNDYSKVKCLYHDHVLTRYLSLGRSERDWEEIKETTSTDIYLYRKEGNVVGYFFANKGADLSNIIHEYVFPELLDNEILNILSSYSLWLPEKYNTRFNKKEKLYAALFCPGRNFPRLIESWSNEKISQVEIDHHNISFIFNSETFTLTLEEFIQGIWGPNPIEEFESIGKPIYISGADSI